MSAFKFLAIPSRAQTFLMMGDDGSRRISQHRVKLAMFHSPEAIDATKRGVTNTRERPLTAIGRRVVAIVFLVCERARHGHTLLGTSRKALSRHPGDRMVDQRLHCWSHLSG
jgi:hypothetical protein